MFFWLRSLIIAIWQRTRPEFYQVIDPNAKCPWCGWRKGKLETVEAIDEKLPPDKAKLSARAVVRHTCLICGGRWVEEPIGVLIERIKP